jgi:hypothetical protein
MLVRRLVLKVNMEKIKYMLSPFTRMQSKVMTCRYLIDPLKLGHIFCMWITWPTTSYFSKSINNEVPHYITPSVSPQLKQNRRSSKLWLTSGRAMDSQISVYNLQLKTCRKKHTVKWWFSIPIFHEYFSSSQLKPSIYSYNVLFAIFNVFQFSK